MFLFNIIHKPLSMFIIGFYRFQEYNYIITLIF